MRRWFLRELERRERAWETERRMLVETICRLAGQPVAPSEMDEWRDRAARDQARRARDAEDAADDLVDYDQTPYDL